MQGHVEAAGEVLARLGWEPGAALLDLLLHTLSPQLRSTLLAGGAGTPGVDQGASASLAPLLSPAQAVAASCLELLQVGLWCIWMPFLSLSPCH